MENASSDYPDCHVGACQTGLRHRRAYSLPNLLIELANSRQRRAVWALQMWLRCQEPDLIVRLVLLNCTVHNDSEKITAHIVIVISIVNSAVVVKSVDF